MITAQRDDVDIDWPPAADHPITIRMPLDPLSRDEAHVLIEAMLGDDNNPALADQLFERSGGNPLFLTELADDDRGRPGEHDAARIVASPDRRRASTGSRPARGRCWTTRRCSAPRRG